MRNSAALITVAVLTGFLLTGCSGAALPGEPGTGDAGRADTGRHTHTDTELASTPPPATSIAPDVVRRFAAAWVRRDLPAAQWWSGVAPLCSTEYAAVLRSTDPGAVPASKVTGDPQKVRDVGSLAYEVPTDAGTLTVTVSPRKRRWLVTDAAFTRAVSE